MARIVIMAYAIVAAVLFKKELPLSASCLRRKNQNQIPLHVHERFDPVSWVWAIPPSGLFYEKALQIMLDEADHTQYILIFGGTMELFLAKARAEIKKYAILQYLLPHILGKDPFGLVKEFYVRAHVKDKNINTHVKRGNRAWAEDENTRILAAQDSDCILL
jgi:hypothetical protein